MCQPICTTLYTQVCKKSFPYFVRVVRQVVACMANRYVCFGKITSCEIVTTVLRGVKMKDILGNYSSPTATNHVGKLTRAFFQKLDPCPGRIGLSSPGALNWFVKERLDGLGVPGRSAGLQVPGKPGESQIHPVTNWGLRQWIEMALFMLLCCSCDACV